MPNSTPGLEQPNERVAVAITPEAVGPTRRAVGRAAAAAGIGTDRIDDLLLAVSEATTNAIEEHLRGGISAPVEVGCVTTARWFEVSVRDCGRGFDAARVPVRAPLTGPLAEQGERGWGIQLMRELVDEVVYESNPGGTTVYLRIAR